MKKKPTPEQLETKELLDRVKKELGDQLCDMRGRPLDGVTDKEFKQQLKDAILEVWTESHMSYALPEKPEVEFESLAGGWIRAKPKNESAKRIMQMMNLTHPTHKIKGEQSGKEQKA